MRGHAHLHLNNQKAPDKGALVAIIKAIIPDAKSGLDGHRFRPFFLISVFGFLAISFFVLFESVFDDPRIG